MKIAVVGGGSTYTPELADGFGELSDSLGASEIVLIDPDRSKLEIIGPLCQRIIRKHGSNMIVSWTNQLEEGLDGAGAVIIQLRVGGQDARIQDESFPAQCDCIGQETTGAGGLAKALRTVPVVLDIAQKIRQHALPGAWIVNFTNPVGIMTRALLDHGHKAIGLCNVAIGFQRHFASLLECRPEELTLEHVGLNHLTWEQGVWKNGVDQLPLLLDKHLEAISSQVDMAPDILLRHQAIPSYYLRYFYYHDFEVSQHFNGPTRGQKVADIEAQLLKLYEDPQLDVKPDILSQRGGAYYSQAAVGLLTSLMKPNGVTHPVNIRNNGHFPFLPDEAVIEVNCDITAESIVPTPISPLPAHYRGLISSVAAYEELALKAALSPNRKVGAARIYDALLAHPLVGQHAQAEKLTNLTLSTGHQHLTWYQK